MPSKPASPDNRPPGPAPRRERRRDRSWRQTILPSLGVGGICFVVAVQEHAPYWVAALVGLLVTVCVLGMLALKRGLYVD